LSLSCPRIVVAGTNSGVGKTSVTLALVSALKKRGLRVQTFKVGPDYLDPTYLAIASGRPCYNLDGWMTGEDYVKRLFVNKAAAADISIIEGVMGLYDSSDPVGREGSTAENAAWLQAPTLLVINAHGMSRSIGALVKGYTDFEPDINIVGIVANQVGSERHGDWLAESLKSFGLPDIVSAIPRGSLPGLPSRHLGLVSADSQILSHQILDDLAHSMERYGSVDDIVKLAGSAPQIASAAQNQRLKGVETIARLGVARDPAFHFYYQDNLEAFASEGCELLEFSPLKDRSLPDGLNGVYFGGGYPEEYADELSRNQEMLHSVRSFAGEGKTVYGECGGLMYLSQGIESRNGEKIELVGLLPNWTRMLTRRKSLGYVEVTLTGKSLFGGPGQQFRGHEFHYSELIGDPVQNSGWNMAYKVRRRRANFDQFEGFQRDKTLVSYVHGHFASKPDLIKHFVDMLTKARNHEK
jgi:cobyrinic acid a,c-diamide synthase